MNFDIRTLSVSISTVVIGSALISTLAWRYATSQRTIIGYWSLSQGLVGAGLVLVVLRNTIPDFFSVIIANTCIIGGHMAVQEGIALFMDKKGYLRKVTCISGVTMVAVFLYLTYAVPSVSSRIVALSLTAMITSVSSILTLRTDGDAGNAPRRSLIMLFSFHVLIMLFRAIYAIYQGEYAGFLQSGMLQSWGMLGALSFYASLPLCLFWLIARRLGLEVQRQATTDALTELPNRRCFDERYDLLWRNAVRQGKPLSVLMADIDWFKAYNDTYGHQGGDDCLKKVAETLKQETKRATDFVARYGGEEFTIVLPDTEAEAAEQVAERLRSRVEALNISHQGSPLQRVTISVGVATLVPATGQSSQDLIKLSDEALYVAKHSSRNIVKRFCGSNGNQ